MKASFIPVFFSLSAWCVWAAPAADPDPNPEPTLGSSTNELEQRQLIGGLLSGLLKGIDSAINAGNTQALTSTLAQVTPTARPSSAKQAIQNLSKIHAARPSANVLEWNAMLEANGLLNDPFEDLIGYAEGALSEENSHTNSNPDPPTTVYPKKGECDAPYSVDENTLRSAIYIPPSFTYGEKPPVILFPGTASTGYLTYAGNFIPLLSESDWADPVWVNVPHFLLDDAQVNSEFAAYALNYIASVTNQNVSIIGWSQGNVNTQWAFKYWPSTREVTSDHVSISADYHGTIFANFAGLSIIANDPAVVQQEYTSNFIATLRANNGDSGYVPTTVVYSGFFDEIVEPQQGVGASAYLKDARGVGVTNTEVQVACPGQPAGSFYSHEGMLYNPIAFGLAEDAIRNTGPGQLSRIDRSSLCQLYLAPGLGLDDLLITENVIAVAALAVVLYEPKVLVEPPIRPYATGTQTCTA